MKFLFALILILNGFTAYSQQAWTQKKGEGYFQIGTSFFNYETTYNNNYETGPIPRPISETIFLAYGEIGVFDRLMATVAIPIHFTSSSDLASDWIGFSPEKGKLNGLGNIYGALTYSILDKNGFVLSAKTGVSLNTSVTNESTGLRTGFNTYGITPTLLAGIGTSHFFASMETGITYSGKDYLNRYIFNVQIGKEFTKSKKILGIIGIVSNSTIGKATIGSTLDGNAKFTSLYLNEQAYFAINLKMGYKFSKNWATWLSVSGGTAKNTGQNLVYSFSIGYNLVKQ